MMRLCFRPSSGRDDAIPLVPAILQRAMNGDGKAASELAARRLRASGKAPLVNDLPVGGDTARRTAAAMLFPIASHEYDTNALLHGVFLAKKEIAGGQCVCHARSQHSSRRKA